MSLLPKQPFKSRTINSVKRELAVSSDPSVRRASSNSCKFNDLPHNKEFCTRDTAQKMSYYSLRCQNPKDWKQFWIRNKNRQCLGLPTMTECLKTVRNSFRHHFYVSKLGEKRLLDLPIHCNTPNVSVKDGNIT